MPRSLPVQLLALLVVALPALRAHATSALRLDVPALVAESSAVIEVRVREQSVVTDARGRSFTETELELVDLLAGDAPAKLVLRQVGGVVGERHSRLLGDAQLTPGERAVLFVTLAPDGRWYLTALAQSAFHVLDETEGARVERRFDGLSLFEREPGGKLRPSREAHEPTSLAELRAAVLAVRASAGVAR